MLDLLSDTDAVPSPSCPPKPQRHGAKHHNKPSRVPGVNDVPSNVELDNLLLFFCVAETLSFTKAAQQLGIDQSWLSHKIRQFEGSLGLTLFIRNTRNVELTKTGKALLGPAKRLNVVVEQTRAATKMLQFSLTNTLQVGALPYSFPHPYRVALVDQFMQKHADIQVIIKNGPTPVLLDYVLNECVDIAFVSAPIDSNGLDILLLHESPFCMLIPKDHPYSHLPAITVDSLQGLRVVVPSKHFNPAAYAAYYEPLINAGIEAAVVPEFQCAVTYALQWKLPVVCTRAAAEHHLRNDVVIRTLDFIPSCKKYLVRLSDHRTPAQVALWNMAETMRDVAVSMESFNSMQAA